MQVECPQCHNFRELKRPPKKGVVCKDCKNLNMQKTNEQRVTHYRTCNVCGKVTKVKSKAQAKKNPTCRSCYVKQGIEARTRVCKVCGDIRIVSTAHDAKVTDECRSCASKHRRGGFKKRYIYFCPSCSVVKSNPKKRKSAYCRDCYKHHKKEKIYYFDYEDMSMKLYVPKPRFFRICPHCPVDVATIAVKSIRSAGIRPCRKHKWVGKEDKHLEANRKLSIAKTGTKLKTTKPKIRAKHKVKKSKGHGVSKEVIERERQKNRKHKEAIKNSKKEVKQTLSEEEMIKQFLKKNKPSVVDKVKEIPHMFSVGILVNDSL